MRRARQQFLFLACAAAFVSAGARAQSIRVRRRSRARLRRRGRQREGGAGGRGADSLAGGQGTGETPHVLHSDAQGKFYVGVLRTGCLGFARECRRHLVRVGAQRSGGSGDNTNVTLRLKFKAPPSLPGVELKGTMRVWDAPVPDRCRTIPPSIRRATSGSRCRRQDASRRSILTRTSGKSSRCRRRMPGRRPGFHAFSAI